MSTQRAWMTLGIGVIVAWVSFIVTCIAGWLTHVIICIQGGMWGFLIAGAIFFPVGIVHGIGHWFGAW